MSNFIEIIWGDTTLSSVHDLAHDRALGDALTVHVTRHGCLRFVYLASEGGNGGVGFGEVLGELHAEQYTKSVYPLQALHTTLALDGCGKPSYQFGMGQLTKLRKRAGLSQSTLAARAGTSQPQINRLEKGEREMTGHWAIRLSPHLNTYPEVLVFGDRTVPIVGYIGAASEAHFLPTELGRARMPMGGDKNTVAVEIRGDSLGPIENWIAYYDQRREPPTDDMMGELCVVGLPDGQVFVKRLHRAKEAGLYDLWPAYGKPILNQKVEWAAVVMALLRPSFARVEPTQEPETDELTRKSKKRPTRRKT